MRNPIHSPSTPSSDFHVQLLLLFRNILLLVPAGAQQPPTEKSAQLSAPFETIKNFKEFNAVRFGPGNTFSIVETLPDFRLSEFAISRDGRLLAMGFGSGRIELWDIHTKKRIHEFKSEIGAPGVLKFNVQVDQLMVTGNGGNDVHEIALDRNGKWLAYADEESINVIDLGSQTLPSRLWI
jgi:WD40 repeat protein